jgi:hypothetical protein
LFLLFSYFKDEAYILRKLFDGEDVKSIVSHDMLVEKSDQEHVIIEAEANRVAQR